VTLGVGLEAESLGVLGRRRVPRALIGALDDLGGLVLAPVELVGMAIILSGRVAEYIALAPVARQRFAFHTLILRRDLRDLLIEPAIRVIAISVIFAVAFALILGNLAAGLLSQMGTANLVVLAAVQQIPAFVASGILAARGALPLSIRVAEMVDRGQVDSMAMMGVPLVMLHAVPRCIAVTAASLVHAALATVVFGITTIFTFAHLGLVPSGSFVIAVQAQPVFEKAGLIGVQLVTASLMAVSVAVIHGLQRSVDERLDLSRVSMVCMLKAATVVLIVNMTFALIRLPDLPVIVWR
jgi:ABC-type transporter Mla maintaining outer membrane lipid asymmetry permease subunit MlaE